MSIQKLLLILLFDFIKGQMSFVCFSLLKTEKKTHITLHKHKFIEFFLQLKNKYHKYTAVFFFSFKATYYSQIIFTIY